MKAASPRKRASRERCSNAVIMSAIAAAGDFSYSFCFVVQSSIASCIFRDGDTYPTHNAENNGDNAPYCTNGAFGCNRSKYRSKNFKCLAGEW
jgi:hypothetical protein